MNCDPEDLAYRRSSQQDGFRVEYLIEGILGAEDRLQSAQATDQSPPGTVLN